MKGKLRKQLKISYATSPLQYHNFYHLHQIRDNAGVGNFMPLALGVHVNPTRRLRGQVPTQRKSENAFGHLLSLRIRIFSHIRVVFGFLESQRTF